MAYVYPFKSAGELLILSVWERGNLIENRNPNVWRLDICGDVMDYSEHGNTNSEHGWEIDHKVPIEKVELLILITSSHCTGKTTAKREIITLGIVHSSGYKSSMTVTSPFVACSILSAFSFEMPFPFKYRLITDGAILFLIAPGVA